MTVRDHELYDCPICCRRLALACITATSVGIGGLSETVDHIRRDHAAVHEGER